MDARITPRQWFVLFSIAALLALLIGLLHWQSKVAHAMDCEVDCMSGLPPSPEPEDPGGPEDPGDDNDNGDPNDPPGGGGGCVSSWNAPAINPAFVLDPPYPITIGQDPDDRGVDIRGATARGGANRCPNGAPAKITSLAIQEVRLAPSSVTWITGELARKYPGARVKGAYPFVPAYSASGQGTPVASLAFHLDPLDPGYYDVTIKATQSDGQCITAVIQVPVHLMESTIIQ